MGGAPPPPPAAAGGPGARAPAEEPPLPEDPGCHGERHLDLDGPALTWGLSYRVNSSAECCAACQVFEDPDPRNWTCNSWVCCPEETCWSPDVWNHTRGECWLKMQEHAAEPAVNLRGDYPAAFRREHTTAPRAVQWMAGHLPGKPGRKVGP